MVSAPPPTEGFAPLAARLAGSDRAPGHTAVALRHAASAVAGGVGQRRCGDPVVDAVPAGSWMSGPARPGVPMVARRAGAHLPGGLAMALTPRDLPLPAELEALLGQLPAELDLLGGVRAPTDEPGGA